MNHHDLLSATLLSWSDELTELRSRKNGARDSTTLDSQNRLRGSERAINN